MSKVVDYCNKALRSIESQELAYKMRCLEWAFRGICRELPNGIDITVGDEKGENLLEYCWDIYRHFIIRCDHGLCDEEIVSLAVYAVGVVLDNQPK